MIYDDETLKLITTAMVKYASAHDEVHRLLDEMNRPLIHVHPLTDEQRAQRASPTVSVIWGTAGGKQ